MKVAELIEVLQSQPQDAEVHFQYNYNDYWRTQVADRVVSVEYGPVVFSEYHNMDKVVQWSEAEPDGPADARQVVLLG